MLNVDTATSPNASVTDHRVIRIRIGSIHPPTHDVSYQASPAMVSLIHAMA
jgi:hypothetical protein